MSASADVLAQAKVEIDLSLIPEGKNVSNGLSNAPTDISDETAGHYQMAR